MIESMTRFCFIAFTAITLACQVSNAAAACWTGGKSARPAYFILAMGANTGKVKLAENDARAFAKAMQKRFKVPASHVCTLTRVTRWQLIDALKKLRKKVRKQDRVIIYFSGHGTFLPDNNQDEDDCVDEAFVPVYRKDLETESVRDDQFVRLANKIGTKHITTFLDTCFAGGLRKGGRKACPRAKNKFLVKGKAGKALRRKNCRVRNRLRSLKGTLYAASRENQGAWEVRDMGGGRFTRTFLKIMKKHPKAGLDRVFNLTTERITVATKGTVCYQRPQRWSR